MKKFLCGIIVIVTVMTLLQLCAFADTTLNTREQLVDYLTRQAASKPAEIPFRYGTALESNISNSSWMGSVMNDAGIFSARWSYGGGKCTLKSIDYMPDHVTCSSENEVISALHNARNGSVNIRVSQSLFDKLSANNFARLHQLEGEAGIDSRSMSYYTSSRLFLYSEIKYAKNFSSVSSYSEIRSLMLSYHSRGVTSYSFHCSDALFKQMIADDFAKLHQIEGEAGFSKRQMTYTDRPLRRIIQSGTRPRRSATVRIPAAVITGSSTRNVYDLCNNRYTYFTYQTTQLLYCLPERLRALQ